MLKDYYGILLKYAKKMLPAAASKPDERMKKSNCLFSCIIQNMFPFWKWHSFLKPVISNSFLLHCNKDLETGVKEENKPADKPPKLVPISQDDINIIALVPKTTLYWFA